MGPLEPPLSSLLTFATARKDQSRHLLGLGSPSLDLSARQWLGQDSFVAWLRQDGRVESLEGGVSQSSFSHITMNGRGELLGISGEQVSAFTVSYLPADSVHEQETTS